MIDVTYEGRFFSNLEREFSVLFGVPLDVYDAEVLKKEWADVRKKRDSLLRACDYAVMPDYPLTEAQKAEVTAYRQALRDIPQGFDSPDTVEWPAKPEVLA